MYRKLSLMAMALGVLFLGSVLVIAFSGASSVDAQSDSAAEFVGSDTCGDCHFVQAEQQEQHGHSNILTPVDGEAPEFPHDYVVEPPEGYTWDDISFVNGGFTNSIRFLDQNGYVITGTSEEAMTQYDLPIVDERTGDVIAEGRWVAYRPGEPERAYTCGSCHTTGYNHDRNTHMYDMPGLVGEWAEEGVQCEECHGAGSLHVEDPISVNMLVDGSSESCANCHYRGEVGDVDARDGFLRYHEQYDEVLKTPHAALDCVACHDPHRSVQYADEDANPMQGLRNVCTDCHFSTVSSEEHIVAGVTCVDCHMAPAVANANRNEELHWGDTSTHLFQINTNPDAEQFNDDGSVSMPYLTLSYVCTRCHVDTPIEDLAAAASGYHD
jgi:hypothetical protein